MVLWTSTTRNALVYFCVIVSLADRAQAQTPGVSDVRQSDVIYGRKFGMALTMEVFTPRTQNGSGVLWVVSSSGRSSREQTLQDSFDRRIAPLLDRGYTVFAVLHGSVPVFNLQDHVSDVRRAVRFVRHNAARFAVDPQRLGLSGSSAGGLLALLVALNSQAGDTVSQDAVERESTAVQAVGCFFPPTDLLNYGAASRNVIELMQARGADIDPAFQFYDLGAGGARKPVTAREDVLRILRELSPIAHVTTDDPPTILLHGAEDRAVPVPQSQVLAERLRAVGVPTRLVTRAGAGHAYPGWESDVALIADWFDEYLRRRR
jgi:acetyl esterase/lipase